jgi:tetratricopeptide (TPR) repeat protein
MGLVQEHDEWFKISWEQIGNVLKLYPDCDNTCNTAAWLASRALQNLDQARNYEQHALTLNPEQPAYMDTMAEIEFARGNREKAIEWSTKAVNSLPR